MNVGVLGATGPAGSAVAARLAAAGVEVVIGSRVLDRATATCEEIKARWPDRDLTLEPGDNAAAAKADVVVVATPWDGAPPTVAGVAGELAGKVVISMGNALVKIGPEFQSLIPPRGSVAAAVQAAAPDALVAAAFHHIPARNLADLLHDLEDDVLVCSDHAVATQAAMDLVGAIPGLRPLDAGRLASAAPIEAFTAVLLQLNVRYKTRAGLRITGID